VYLDATEISVTATYDGDGAYTIQLPNWVDTVKVVIKIAK